MSEDELKEIAETLWVYVRSLLSGIADKDILKITTDMYTTEIKFIKQYINPIELQ